MDGKLIKSVVLEVINLTKDKGAGYFQQDVLLREISEELKIRGNEELERALLTVWYDLFRAGHLSWGHNLSNPNPPFIHITETGRAILQNLSRDPSNEEGYIIYKI
ncbi:hypothetical protein BACCIP111895_04298 [Neobacillus rhizosphaerae]|uniref:Restriction system protein Mrr-like N-terminal domain-containing protein n=1 Tax=Neobacillus rhizosphaerae TaxID=2880965 RepID=A0ABM9EWS8_9BACI|nr:hypothetical protein [Neobacillus rhizosphaerae]CAH2717109.1 hypothetical protein BACCIP111895_04298 [Neobacillus rhizosphaerae]